MDLSSWPQKPGPGLSQSRNSIRDQVHTERFRDSRSGFVALVTRMQLPIKKGPSKRAHQEWLTENLTLGQVTGLQFGDRQLNFI